MVIGNSQQEIIKVILWLSTSKKTELLTAVDKKVDKYLLKVYLLSFWLKDRC